MYEWGISKLLLKYWMTYNYKKTEKHLKYYRSPGEITWLNVFWIRQKHRYPNKCLYVKCILQKQSSRGVLWKRCFWKFRKIHRKTPAPESLFNKVADPRATNLWKKSFWHSCFPVNFAKFLRTPSFTEHFWWHLVILLLKYVCMLAGVCTYRMYDLVIG